MRLRRPFMTARRAFQYQCVLRELIAQLVDMKFVRHGTDCYEPSRTCPSSTENEGTLYKHVSLAPGGAVAEGMLD